LYSSYIRECSTSPMSNFRGDSIHEALIINNLKPQRDKRHSQILHRKLPHSKPKNTNNLISLWHLTNLSRRCHFCLDLDTDLIVLETLWAHSDHTNWVYVPFAKNHQAICKTKIGNYVIIASSMELEVLIVTHLAKQPWKDFHT